MHAIVVRAEDFHGGEVWIPVQVIAYKTLHIINLSRFTSTFFDVQVKLRPGLGWTTRRPGVPLA